MGENNLAALIVRATTLGVLVLIAALASCQMHRDYRQAEALKAGINPVGISCVYSTSSTTDCALTAASK